MTPSRAARGIALLFILWCATSAQARAIETGRVFSLTYAVEVDAAHLKGPVDVFVPLAQDTPHQQILARRISASVKGREQTEDAYGNRFWHAHLDEGANAPLRVQVRYRVRRRAAGPTVAPGADTALFLRANARVPVDDPLVERVLADVPPPARDTKAGWARAIFEYTVATMEYKKVGTGWGNGDTYWACSQRYGNCTDFHALFISLARKKNIPARFEVGFPVPTHGKRGTLAGYHCWVSFYDGRAWVPLDASEAKKHLDQKDRYFGAQPADRILFTIGRDLRLGAGHRTAPLNFFIYPHVEVGGKALGPHEIHLRVSYVDEER